MKKPSKEIRAVWQEMRELKVLSDYGPDRRTRKETKKFDKLMDKYIYYDIDFGHESSLLKAIIYYLDSN